jgi:hypothetical protein
MAALFIAFGMDIDRSSLAVDLLGQPANELVALVIFKDIKINLGHDRRVIRLCG